MGAASAVSAVLENKFTSSCESSTQKLAPELYGLNFTISQQPPVLTLGGSAGGLFEGERVGQIVEVFEEERWGLGGRRNFLRKFLPPPQFLKRSYPPMAVMRR